MKYPLGYNTWTKAEINAATKTILSGNYTMGKKLKNLKINLQKDLELNMQLW